VESSHLHLAKLRLNTRDATMRLRKILEYSLESGGSKLLHTDAADTVHRDAAMKIQQKAGIFIVLRCLLVLTKDTATSVIMHLLMKAI